MYFFDIVHPCYDQLTQDICWPVSHDHIAGSSLQLIEVACFFEVDRWPSAGFSIGSWAQLRLTCWKQCRIVRKPVNANPGLKVNWIITFSSIQMFFCCFVFVFRVIIKTQNRRPNNIQKTSTQSYKTQIKILATFSWVIWLRTTRPRSYAFRLA